MGSYTIRTVDPRAIVERVWPDAAATVEPLGGGITNHNFKVTVEGSAYVLRVGGKDTDKNGRACLLARKLSEAGIRQAYPDAGEREIFLRLAQRQLGDELFQKVYGDEWRQYGSVERRA